MNPISSIHTRPSADAIEGTLIVNAIAAPVDTTSSLTIHPAWLRTSHWLIKHV